MSNQGHKDYNRILWAVKFKAHNPSGHGIAWIVKARILCTTHGKCEVY